MKRIPVTDDALENWRVLNKALPTKTEEECRVLLKKEREGRKRLQVLLRIYSRYSVLRREREMRELCQ